MSIGFNWTPEQIAWLENEAQKFMDAQAAHVKEVADREAARVAAYLAEHPQGPLNDDEIRMSGGYLLMDPQWVVSEWPGVSGAETNTPEYRRNTILQMAEAGHVLPFERDGEIAGYFPAANNPGSVAHAIEIGNAIVDGTLSAGQYVRGGS